jgi:hypothetical protein
MRKSNLKRFNNIANGDMSGNLVSAVSNVEFIDNLGIQLNFTGSPVGTFQVLVSIDYDQDNNGNVINAGHWVPIVFPEPVAGSSISTSVGSPIYINLNQVAAPWIKVTYTASSGSGILNSYICGKMI